MPTFPVPTSLVLTWTGVTSGNITGTPSALPANWELVNGYLIGPGADLTDADLSGADLSGADLSGADLTGVTSGNITGTPSALPTNWELVDGYLIGPGADLTDADLSGAELKFADLADANLTGANVTGADLLDAELVGANLTGADLTDADLTGVMSGNITGTPAALPADWALVGGYLIGPKAELVDAALSGAELSGADLNQTDLTGADLAHADLTGADLANAQLGYADLAGADLNDVTWRNTTCPDGTNSDNDGGTCVDNLG